ncbi:MAG: hypothetical protein RI900_288 [Actinomycetota bacterium]
MSRPVFNRRKSLPSTRALVHKLLMNGMRNVDDRRTCVGNPLSRWITLCLPKIPLDLRKQPVQSVRRTGKRTPTGTRGKVPRNRSSQRWPPGKSEGQPGSRDGSGFGRRMILILTGGPRAEGGELVRSTGQPGKPSRQSGPRSGSSGNRRTVTGQRLRRRRTNRATGEATGGHKRDRPPGLTLRRAMTLVETKANARRSVDGGSLSSGVAPGGAPASAGSAARGASLFRPSNGPPPALRPQRRTPRGVTPGRSISEAGGLRRIRTSRRSGGPGRARPWRTPRPPPGWRDRGTAPSGRRPSSPS